MPKNEAGVIFKYKDRILLGNPDYLMVMRYRICSDFPLHEIIAFHKEQEKKYKRKDEEEANNGKALVTVMTARLDILHAESNHKTYGVFGIDEKTHEVLHFTEENEAASQMMKSTPQGLKVSPPANCGIYLFSVRVFEEFGLSSRTTAADGDTESHGFNTGGNTTPRESAVSFKSGASGSEFGKFFTSHQNQQIGNQS